MAIILCPECKKEISSKAPACVYCGCPITDEDRIQNNSLTEEEQLEIALQYYKDGKYAKSLELYSKLADCGNAEAQCEMGFFYYDGDRNLNIMKNEKMAIEYFEKSAAQNYGKAEFQIGYINKNVYNNGEKAIYWYERAIEHGYKQIPLNNLGVLYLTGDAGVKQNIELALEYYKKSAYEGYSLAAENLGWIYFNGEYVEKNDMVAKKYFEAAVLCGSETAQNIIDNYFTETHPTVSYQIKCPNCCSQNVHKIGAISKGVSYALWGVFSLGKITKTYECDNCGYRW